MILGVSSDETGPAESHSGPGLFTDSDVILSDDQDDNPGGI